jgi:hypothetical protein
MSNPTSNYGWQMPTSTDLVTDLPADFEVFGQAVDTALMDLKGGTTGQVLAKASNTDMDFVWSADAAGMTNPMTTTGDTIYSSSGSTPARLGIGTTGQVLTVAGGIPSWATASSAADNYTLINAGGTALTGATTITVSGISGKNSLIIVVNGASSVNPNPSFEMRFNADSTFKYDWTGVKVQSASTVVDSGFASNNSIDIAALTSAAAGTVSMVGKLDGAGSTGLKFFNFTSYSSNLGNGRASNYTYSGTSTISSVSIISSSGNFDAGTIYVYGA